MKTCNKCQLEKEEDCFSKGRNTCKPCRSKANSERLMQRYHNEDGFKEALTQYRKDNPDKLKAWKRTDYEKNKEQYKAQAKRWNDENRAVRRQVVRRYKVKRAEWELNGSFTQSEWESLLDATGHKCLCCGATDVTLTQDHVVPLSKGGSNTIDNIQPLCGPCNSSKGVKTIDFRS